MQIEEQKNEDGASFEFDEANRIYMAQHTAAIDFTHRSILWMIIGFFVV